MVVTFRPCATLFKILKYSFEYLTVSATEFYFTSMVKVNEFNYLNVILMFRSNTHIILATVSHSFQSIAGVAVLGGKHDKYYT